MAESSSPPATPQPLNKKLIAAVTAVVFLYWVSLYLYVPTLPVYVQGKVDDLALVGTILSMYGLWQMFSRMPTGIIADWIGRRKPDIFIGLVLTGVGAWIMSSAQGGGGLLVGRAITGIGAGAWVPLVVLFTSLFPPKELIRATALLTVINTLGRMAGTVSTGYLNNLGGYPLAFHLAGAASLLAIVILVLIPEKRRAVQPPSLRKLGALFIRPQVLVPSLLSGVLHYGDWTGSFTFFPILASRYGAGNVTISLLTTLNLAMVLLGNAISAGAAKRLGEKRLLVISFILMGLGLAGGMLAPSLPYVFLAQFAAGCAFGVGYPVLMGMSIKKVDISEQNTAMGLHQSVYALGMFAGPWLSGLLAKAIGVQPMFGVIAGAILVVGLAGHRLLKE
jgi:MFS family permease